MSFVLPDSQGNQEQYIQYLRTVVDQFAKHHSHDHQNCQFVPSARLSTASTSLTAPVTARSESVSEILTPLSGPSSGSKRRQKRSLSDEHESKKILRFISWQPSNQSPKPRNTGTGSWMPLAEKLVHITPLAADWWKEVELLNLDTIMQEGTAAEFVLGGSTETLSIVRQQGTEVSFNGGIEERWLLSAARAYAETAANRALSVRCVLMLVNFQKFIVLCICAVLSEIGASKAALVDITRLCFGNISEEYAVRLWRTAVLLNQVVDGLGFRGWGNRASELLLIWNRSPTYYENLTWAPDTALEYLTAELSTDLYTQGIGERGGWTSLFVPSLTYNLLGQKINIARISHHLRYQHPDMLNPATSSVPINPWRFFRLGS